MSRVTRCLSRCLLFVFAGALVTVDVAVAEDVPSTDALCTALAEALVEHRDDCPAMASAIRDFTRDHGHHLRRLVRAESEVCDARMEEAGSAVEGCAEDPAVDEAMMAMLRRVENGPGIDDVDETMLPGEAAAIAIDQVANGALVWFQAEHPDTETGMTITTRVYPEAVEVQCTGDDEGARLWSDLRIGGDARALGDICYQSSKDLAAFTASVEIPGKDGRLLCVRGATTADGGPEIVDVFEADDFDGCRAGK